nr:hypothetical protein [uncultured Nitrososphaera sp.]
MAGLNTAATRLASTEKENLLQVLRARYVAPQRLRKHHKDLIKMIKSLEQGYDGTIAVCFFCKRLMEVTKMQLHHTTYNVFDNRLEVLELCDQECNNNDHARKRLANSSPSSLTLRESENQTPAQAGTQRDESNGAPELVKHNTMRGRFDRWIRDPVNGAFASRVSWPRDLLAETAPYSCSLKLGEALGSSKTYLKFIKEDIAGSILLSDNRDGVEFVLLNKDFLKKIQEQTGQ